MLIKDVGLGIAVGLPHVFGLLQGYHAGNGVAVGEVHVVLFPAGALHKGDGIESGDLAVLGHFFKLSVGHHFGIDAVAEMLIAADIGRNPAGGQNDRAIFLGLGVFFHIIFQAGIGIFHLALGDAVLIINTDLGRGIPLAFGAGSLEGGGEIAGSAADAGNLGGFLDADLRIGFNRGYQSADGRLLQRRIGSFGGELLGPAEGLAAEGTGFFDNGYLIAGLGRLLGCGKTGDAAAQHQDPSGHGIELVRFGQFGLFCLDARHAHIVLANFRVIFLDGIFAFLLGRLFHAPGSLLANVAADGDLVIAEMKLILHDPG